MSKGKGIIGAIVTVVIGGAVYSVNQADIVENFSKDTGMSQEASEQYVESITEDDMVSYDEYGLDAIALGEDFISAAAEIDCVNYEYEWETISLSCEEGKSQFIRLGNGEIALGKAYRILDSESASTEDISTVINLIGKSNANLSLEIISQLLDYPTIFEMKKENSYNKAVLQAALDSD